MPVLSSPPPSERQEDETYGGEILQHLMDDAQTPVDMNLTDFEINDDFPSPLSVSLCKKILPDIFLHYKKKFLAVPARTKRWSLQLQAWINIPL